MRFLLLTSAVVISIVGCAAPKNAAIGTWSGVDVEPGANGRQTPERLVIDDKTATLYDGTGTAVGNFPVAFPAQNEAVISGSLGMTVDVQVQADGSARVVGLSSSSSATSTDRSSDIFHRV